MRERWIRARLPQGTVAELVEDLNLSDRLASLVSWGTCEAWQDRATTEEEFLRNRYRYQLTEAGAALNQAVRAIEEDLGAGSTAVLLAPAVLADRLRAALDALAGERIDDASREEADCLRSSGFTLNTMGRYDAALAAFQEAADLYQHLDGTEYYRAKCLNGVGTIMHRMGRYEESVAAYQHALELHHRIGARRDQADCLYNSGFTLRDMKRYQEAVTAFQDALDLYRQVDGTPQEEADCLENIRHVLRAMGGDDEARA